MPSSVTKIVVAAEPLSKAKRVKLERMWGAEVFDQFGMTEGALMAFDANGDDHLCAKGQPQGHVIVVDNRAPGQTS